MKKLILTALILLIAAVTLAAQPLPIKITPATVGGGVAFRVYVSETSGAYGTQGIDYAIETAALTVPVDTPHFAPYADRVVYIVVSAVGETGLESVFSPEVTRTFPPNPPAIE